MKGLYRVGEICVSDPGRQSILCFVVNKITRSSRFYGHSVTVR